MVARFKMVGKLIKHELYSTVRVAVIPAVIMILLAILSRVMLETSSSGITITAFAFYIFSVMATLLIGYLFGIQSFYQSLFTGTGYLTLSLPVTADQLIWSKLISAITVMFASIIICMLSACIFFIGLPADLIEEIGEAFSSFGNLIAQFAQGEPLFFFELILVIILGIPMSLLVFYAMMSIGQLFTVKNRKGIAIGLFIALMFAWSMLSETVIADINAKMLAISIHLYMWIKIIFYALVDVGCYFLVRYIIKNKVNLLA